MSRIRSRDTVPEMLVRSALHRSGFRFRLHSKDLPGMPDLVLRKYNTVVFVHGCFWHRHKGCSRCTTPSSNQEYWLPKLSGNAMRDKKNRRALTGLGWNVVVIWECETKDPLTLEKSVSSLAEKIRRTNGNCK